MQSIESLWAEHQAAPFPAGCRGAEVDGVDLVLVDADVAGCVSAFLGNRASLDEARRRVLHLCAQELARITPSLQGEAQIYFARLRELAAETLRSLG